MKNWIMMMTMGMFLTAFMRGPMLGINLEQKPLLTFSEVFNMNTGD